MSGFAHHHLAVVFILTGSRTGWRSAFVVFERIGDSGRNHCVLFPF